MRKLFLLGFLFIFMGNVSADIKLLDAKEGIVVYCIKDYVFVKAYDTSLVQVMISVNGHKNTKNFPVLTRPMLCEEYAS